MENKTMVYKAQKDKEVYIFPLTLEIIVLILKICRNGSEIEEILLTVLFSSVIVLFILINMLTIKYIFTESELIIKTCIFRTTLRLDKITDISQTRGGYSFSASAREQLKFTYRNDRIIHISPQNILEFEKYLNDMCRKSYL